MNLRHLKIFKTVCKEENMSAAARKLHITQPAISQTISNFEQKLGAKLFDRLNKRLVLTNTGKILLNYSNRILNLVEEAEQTIDDINNLKQGELRIGASMTIGTYLLPEVINQFQQQYPQVEIKFIIDNTKVIEGMVLENKIDLGLIEGPTSSQNIIRENFFDDHLLIVCSTNHKWANKQLIQPTELKKVDFIIREKGSGTREVIENTLNNYQIEYKIQHTLNNIEAIKKAIIANMGISILPKIAIKEELDTAQLSTTALKGIKFNRKFNFIYHQDKYKSNLFEKFITYLKKNSSN